MVFRRFFPLTKVKIQYFWFHEGWGDFYKAGTSRGYSRSIRVNGCTLRLLCNGIFMFQSGSWEFACRLHRYLKLVWNNCSDCLRVNLLLLLYNWTFAETKTRLHVFKSKNEINAFFWLLLTKAWGLSHSFTVFRIKSWEIWSCRT